MSGADYKVPVLAADHRGKMCPSRLALEHPAADLLMEYVIVGCLTKTGKDWTMLDLKEAIDVGSHVSALDPEAMAKLWLEVKEKEAPDKQRLCCGTTYRRIHRRRLKYLASQ